MKKINPNGYDCSECEHWDDVNGCWKDFKDVRDCSIIIEGVLNE